MDQIGKHNTLAKTHKSDTNYNPHRKIQLYKELIPVNREELKEQIKAKKKKSWRGKWRVT